MDQFHSKNRSDIVDMMAEQYQEILPYEDVEHACKIIFGTMSDALTEGDRIELRGFGVFSLRSRSPRVGRNPKTGEEVSLSQRFSVHFRPGKKLKLALMER